MIINMNDPYVYKNGTLKNKLNITDYNELKQAEADIGFLKLANVDSINVLYFDAELIKKIHKHIFEDIFEWAGNYRKVPLIKEELVLPGYSIPYTDYKLIEKELKLKIQELNNIAWQNLSLEEIAFCFAREMALIWKIHPFRDGNTRTCLVFSYLYAKEHGFPFDIKTFTSELNRKYKDDGTVEKYSIRDKFVLACLDDKDYPEVMPLASVFEKAIAIEKERKASNSR